MSTRKQRKAARIAEATARLEVSESPAMKLFKEVQSYKSHPKKVSKLKEAKKHISSAFESNRRKH